MLDEQYCSGCTYCSVDCPFEAIAMVPRTLGVGSELVAQVDPSRCVSCGICAGACAPMEIGPPLRNGKSQLREMQAFVERAHPAPGDVVVIACQHGAAEHPALAELASHVYPVHCAGSVHTSVVEYLLRRGAGGVYLLACPERDCTYREGPRLLGQRLYAGREAELQQRVDARRVRLGGFSHARGRAAAADVRAFQREVSALAGTSDAGHAELERECAPASSAAPAEAGHV